MLDYLFSQNLDFWKNKTWKKKHVLRYNKRYRRNRKIAYVIIKNQTIKYNSGPRKSILHIINKFIIDIISKKKFRNLEVEFLIDLGDELLPTLFEIYDFRNNPNDNPNNHNFNYGISELSDEVINIENSYSYILPHPIFTFNKNMEGSIIFPHINLINRSINKFSDSVDNINFFNKKGNTPFYRFSNIRANLFKPSRIKLAWLSFKNPKYLDCKGSHNGNHPGHGNYILQKAFIKLYSKLRIIKLNENKFDSFMEHFNVNNFVSKDELKNYKYLVTNDSWYNNIDYCMWNSILFRYKLEKCKYYEDFIFEDGTDVVIFDEKNFKEKIDGIRNTSAEILVKNIENRKKKVKEYLFYDKLVDHYGQLLMKFSEIQKNNQL